GANIPTPVTQSDLIYNAGAGTGGGLIKLRSQSGGVAFDEVYFSPKLPTAIGGEVKLGDLLYGTTGEALLCIEFTTGKVKWEDRALGTASLCYADNRLYLHGENGEVALVEPNADIY